MSDAVAFFKEILEIMIEEDDVELINGIDVTISLRDIVIFDLSTTKKGEMSLE